MIDLIVYLLMCGLGAVGVGLMLLAGFGLAVAVIEGLNDR